MAVFGKGTKLRYETAPASGLFDPVNGATSISGPSRDVSEIEVTSHDDVSNFRAYISGLQDPGEVTADLNFDPSDATHQQMIDDLDAGTVRAWQIRWQVGASFFRLDFNAFVKSFPTQSPVDAQLQANMTLRVTGSITRVVE
jgi:predicted secreted protein